MHGAYVIGWAKLLPELLPKESNALSPAILSHEVRPSQEDCHGHGNDKIACHCTVHSTGTRLSDPGRRREVGNRGNTDGRGRVRIGIE
ncbi:hypothetical protein I7I50_02490 [Histoplasma capsulatum G186AR]|uniref:Uncharacterized protein n=1 Tax=Ajellomyces capsulatus TaxID=5037 RepID=A0A8H7Z372_AJECA|nr:hypothetical protein I7I52_00846 [Histoplasma capsulatum]QSS71593.1 hypothetical protein I7I50_02490 [Histoplasma capsulatum G186AR]